MVKIVESLPDVQRECETHGVYMAKRVLLMGRERELACPKCAEAEADRLSADNGGKVLSALVASGIPPRYRGAELGRANPESPAVVRAAEKLSRFAAAVVSDNHEGRFVVMPGDAGVGKTWLSCATLKAVMPHVSALYRTEHGIVQAVRDTWGRSDTSESGATDRERKCGLLVLDEVGAGQAGDPVRQRIIFDLIDYRYSHLKPTIICTNLDRGALAEWIGRRAADRVSQCGVMISISGHSLRAQK